MFAPTNDAFTAFLDGAALEDVDNDALAQVLSNHVVQGDIVALSTELTTGYLNTRATFNNEEDAPLSLYVNTDDGVALNGGIDNRGGSVIIADIVASNGVVHVVDGVLGLPDITTFAIADPTFETLVAALTSNEFTFVETLQTANGESPAPFTVFAPTNDAFAALLVDLEVDGLDDINADTLAATLTLHVIAEANVRAEDLTDGAVVTTLNGEDVTIDLSNEDAPAVTDPDGGTNPIIVTNVQAANGVVHAVSRVLRDL